MSIDLQRSWRRAWRSIGAVSDGSALGESLQAAYDEPHRHYHTLQHLGECLALFDAVRALAERPAEVEIGLWFHDAVYDIARSDNEERSADAFTRAARADGVAEDVVDRVGALILATRHAAPARGGDEALLVDIDLAVLAAAPERFAEYERQIRAEYAAVPEALFRARRRALLDALLKRERLYGTAHFQRELEARARANLRQALVA